MIPSNTTQAAFKDWINVHRLSLEKMRTVLSPVQFREVLLAMLGLKVSRVLLTEHELLALHPLFSSTKVNYFFLSTPVYVRPDSLKGSWSSFFAHEGGRGDLAIHYLTYIAREEDQIARAMESESLSDHRHLGQLMQIPECCIDSFVRNFQKTEMKGLDPIRATIYQTPFSLNLDPWCNIASQYFGFSLLSFTPCSFHCLNASLIARFTHQLLTFFDEDLARQFVDHQYSLYIYSDLNGVHRIKKFMIRADGHIQYDPGNVESTYTGDPVYLQLRIGNQLWATSFHQFLVFRDDIVLFQSRGDRYSLLSFSHDRAK